MRFKSRAVKLTGTILLMIAQVITIQHHSFCIHLSRKFHKCKKKVSFKCMHIYNHHNKIIIIILNVYFGKKYSYLLQVMYMGIAMYSPAIALDSGNTAFGNNRPLNFRYFLSKCCILK